MSEATGPVLGCVRRVSLAALFAAGAAHAVPPIVQLPGTAGCVNEDGTDGCADGLALNLGAGVALDPEGRNVYVASQISDAIAVFDRDPATGALTQKTTMEGCVSLTGHGGECRLATDLDGAWALAVSPDGRHLYAVAVFSDSLLTFNRTPAGILGQKFSVDGCTADAASATCAEAKGLDIPRSVTVSPDGRNVYVAAEGDDAVLTFDRDDDGVIAPKGGDAGCLSHSLPEECSQVTPLDGAHDVAVSPDGENVYVAASESDAIVIFDRAVTGGSIGLLTKKADPDGCVSETGAGPCLNGVGLDRPVAVTVSGDGRHVYAVSQTSKAVVVFDRDVATGELEQKAGTDGCVSDDGTGNACATGIALDDPFDVAVSPDGTTVLVASNTGNAVVVFTRDLVTGALTQNPGQAGCVSANGNGGDCVNGRGLVGTQAVAVAPDGRNVYSAMAVSDGVAVFTRLVPSYDVEGDGELTPLTDGVVLLRFLFGFTGAALIADAIDEVNCTRCTAAAIEAYLEALGLTASP